MRLRYVLKAALVAMLEGLPMLMRTTIWMIALTAFATPAKAQVVGSRQELIVARLKKSTNQQMPHDDGLFERLVAGCSTEIDRYFVVWDRELPGRTEREFVNRMGSDMYSMEYWGFSPDLPSIAKAAQMANSYTETIRQRTNELRLYPNSRTMILDDIISLELARCILLVVARMPIPPPFGITPVAQSPQVTTPMPARVFTDAAAAAAAVTAQPGGFDKFADDALAGRSSADVARDEAATQVLWAGERAILKQYPVTQCSDSVLCTPIGRDTLGSVV